MLKSIFYARFHSERGPVVLRQYPRQSIFTSQRNASHDDTQLIHFNNISSYIIPPYELCNDALSIAHNGHLILGWPVSIEDQNYPRNRFTFNVCFVLDDSIDEDSRRAYRILVRKTARWFKGIEQSDGLLSSISEDNDLPQPVCHDNDIDIVSKTLEQVFYQLSEYGECCIPISDVHVLNLRLDIREPARVVAVHGWGVPLLISELPDQATTTWNLVLQQCYPYINGVNHVQKIADLADVELELVRSNIQMLVGTGNAMLLDIFHSQAIYAPTADMAWFIKDHTLLIECQQYITRDKDNPLRIDELIDLYLYLQPSLTMADFVLAHQQPLSTIDLRRMITFGVIKGFLRRVHRYAQLSEPASTQDTSRPATSFKDPSADARQAWRQAALSSGWATPPSDIPASLKTRAPKTESELRSDEDTKLKRYLNGQHCFDQICVEMNMTEKQIMSRLQGDDFGEITFFVR
ncbi:hypothetical protein AMS68_003561 [Peltaster fructicola]|uniref:Nitrogen permease regulator 2 n=1 Tax=Peltaster fructicola TaxID=286661 RepID=A0A6H0XTI7_9PEZI|nr:hypothetical protein AMS68_003561 [Peltaster fructicola]